MKIPPAVSAFFCTDCILSKKLKLIGGFLIAFLGLFLLSRLALFKVASNYFASLSAREVFLCLLIGLRFDFYVIALLVLPFAVGLLLPFSHRTTTKILGILLCLLLAATALFCIADVVFFSMFNNHIGVEFFTAFTHLGLFVQMAFQTYWFVTFPLLILLGLGIRIVNRYCNCLPQQRSAHFVLKSVFLCLLTVLFILLGVRSRLSFHGKALGIMESQVLGSQQTSDLILNNVFYFWQSARTSQRRKLFFTHDPSTISLATQKERLPDPQYPFERQRTAFNLENKNYNFVLILLESFDPDLLYQHPQAAPNLNKIKEESLFFTNFYSSANRSLIAVTATLFSIPYIWGLPTFTQGLGGKNFSRIAQYFTHQGYTTLNVITDRASSDKANEVARYVGFDSFFAKEDIPLKRKYPLFNKGFDYEGFEFFLDKINQAPRRFFGYMFTSSTHGPYQVVLSKEHVRFPNITEKNRFLNRVVYADDALGNFFTRARQEPWFKDTIFFILPDHRVPVLNKQQDIDKTRQNYKSFLLIYAPDIFQPKTIETPATQEDLLPTLLDLLNSPEPFAASGQSLFDEDRSPVKYIYAENKEIHIIDKKTGNHHFMFLDDISSLSAKEQAAIRFNEELYREIKANKFKRK